MVLVTLMLEGAAAGKLAGGEICCASAVINAVFVQDDFDIIGGNGATLMTDNVVGKLPGC